MKPLRISPPFRASQVAGPDPGHGCCVHSGGILHGGIDIFTDAGETAKGIGAGDRSAGSVSDRAKGA